MRLPTIFSCVSAAFLVAATFVVHYKPMGVAIGTFVVILLIVNSRAVRRCCGALVDLCARIRGALCPPVESRDVKQGTRNRE